ncbi:MAG: asparaginase [Alphaproteobacteria bacterium]|nr:asparaginase [Alphaproteobacteria bacterium]
MTVDQHKSPIHVIVTGGTIDSVYNTPLQKMRPASETILPYYLENVVQLYPEVSFETVCMMDSGDMSDATRQKIAEAVMRTHSEQVLISHGTDTMVETALFLERTLGEHSKKTVILTGAMVPLKELVLSDAGFNLGYALSQLSALSPGVYICMNGRTFEPEKVVKNTAIARFEDKAA